MASEGDSLTDALQAYLERHRRTIDAQEAGTIELHYGHENIIGVLREKLPPMRRDVPRRPMPLPLLTQRQ